MFQTFLLPLMLQLTLVPGELVESEYSEDTLAISARHEELDQNALVEALERLAHQGDDSAVQALGEVFNSGLFGADRDPARGCAYFEQLEGRRADALHNLATCYFNGDGRPQDFAKARELYIRAAEAGYRTSFCAYGNMLVRGQGGPVDEAEGIRLCRIAAVAGDRDAQTDYGGYLLAGTGVERDPVTARFILEQAGRQEQRNAAFLLGQIHARGDGTPVDNASAADWFAKAHEWGRPDAAFEVARQFMRRGYSDADGEIRVVPEYLRTAINWLEIVQNRDPREETRQEAANLIGALEQLIDSASR